jgi:hypothetical protein
MDREALKEKVARQLEGQYGRMDLKAVMAALGVPVNGATAGQQSTLERPYFKQDIPSKLSFENELIKCLKGKNTPPLSWGKTEKIGGKCKNIFRPMSLYWGGKRIKYYVINSIRCIMCLKMVRFDSKLNVQCSIV